MRPAIEATRTWRVLAIATWVVCGLYAASLWIPA